MSYETEGIVKHLTVVERRLLTLSMATRRLKGRTGGCSDPPGAETGCAVSH